MRWLIAAGALWLALLAWARWGLREHPEREDWPWPRS
jgi:hypothetical protein